jgi:fluoride exporter
MELLTVALGGALGATLRFAIGGALLKATHRAAIPVPTLTINVAGSLALGAVLGALFGRVPTTTDLLREPLALLLAVGFCGSFTTFSTFSVETVHLLQRTPRTAAVAYITATIAGCLFAFLAGFLITA